MTLEQKLAKVFNLTDENWMKHANPWSVWSRYSVLPVIVLAFWSRAWFGWWCAIPIVLSILWMFFNPIVFNKPKSTKNWASKAVLGERIYLNRDKIPLPEHHNTPLYVILNTISTVGLLTVIWSTISFWFWGAICGLTITYLGKSWFLDRMVWLFEDMKDQHKTYQDWEY